jgi:hypothetical protein
MASEFVCSYRSFAQANREDNRISRTGFDCQLEGSACVAGKHQKQHLRKKRVSRQVLTPPTKEAWSAKKRGQDYGVKARNDLYGPQCAMPSGLLA